MNIYRLLASLASSTFLLGCFSYPLSSGQNSRPDYPFYVTTAPSVVKGIALPVGSKLTYRLPSDSPLRRSFKNGKQDKAINEEFLDQVELPLGQTIVWGGVPVVSIQKFFNTEMRGFSVNPDMNKLPSENRSKFAQLWRSCDRYIDTPRHAVLAVLVKDISDWSFNPSNVADISGCTVNNQRSSKNNAKEQQFLDDLLAALLSTPAK